MPYIKEEDLVKLHSELDQSEKERKKLKKGFIDLKLKSNKAFKQNKNEKWILLLVFIAFIIAIVFLYMNHTETKKQAKKASHQTTLLLDSIQKLSAQDPEEIDSDVIYFVQLGVYRNLDLEFDPEQVTNFKELEKDGLKTYLIGSFLTYNTARKFKNEIKKIGLKDAFLVAYNKNKDRIHIKEALVLSNEEEYIKD
ncbi:MAG: hypothetical protein GKR88_01085 [Flavobacteriaceae bacterium]|nr:MAG: hypothetical protein GKR88_01085 [Flavobacteriaceae bacterium]